VWLLSGAGGVPLRARQGGERDRNKEHCLMECSLSKTLWVLVISRHHTLLVVTAS